MLRGLQILRGVAAILVVIYHTFFWEHKSLSMSFSPSVLRLSEYGVDIFFAISGFIMVYISPRQLTLPAGVGQFLLNRVARIYPPYLAVTAVLTIVCLFRPDLFNTFYGHHVDLLRSFFLLPQKFTPLLIVGWTLIHEQYFYLLASIAFIFSFRGRLLLAIAWGFLVTAVNLIAPPQNNPILQLIFSPFCLTFILGVIIGLFFRFLCRRPICGLFVAAFSVALLWYGHNLPKGGVYPNNNDIMRFAIIGISSCGFMSSAVMLESWLGKYLGCFVFLGDASYSIYLVHLPIIAAFYRLYTYLPLQHLPKIITFIFCVIASIAAGMVFRVIVEVPLLRWSKRLLNVHFSSRSTLSEPSSPTPMSS